MRISDWSSDVCSSDLDPAVAVRDRVERDVVHARQPVGRAAVQARQFAAVALGQVAPRDAHLLLDQVEVVEQPVARRRQAALGVRGLAEQPRSEEHTSELQSLMRISYAVFCLKKKKTLT